MKRVWSAEKDVATGAKMVGMKRVASYAKVPVKPSGSGGSSEKRKRARRFESVANGVDESTASEPRLLLDESAQRRRTHNTVNL
jgi:hypothetical protein